MIATEQSSPVHTLVLAIGSTATGMLPVWLVGGLAVQLRADLGFDEFQLGVLTSTFFGVAALASVPGSRILERVGWKRGIRFTGAVSALGMAAIGLFADTWLLLLAFLVVGAIANSTAQPAANLGLARVIPPNRQGIAFGAKQAAGPLTTMLAGLAVPLIAVRFGWRAAFLLAAILGVALLLGTRGTDTPPAGRPARPHSRRQDTPPVGLLILSVSAALSTAVTNAFGGFVVSFVVVSGLTPGGAGWLYAVGSAVGIVIRLASGWRADTRVGGHLIFCVLMMGGGALSLAVLVLADPLVAIFAVMGFFVTGWSWNGVFTFAVVEMNPSAPAAATGVIMAAKFVGGTVGPLLFGLLVVRASWAAAWFAAAGVMGLAALSMLAGHLYLRHLESRTDDADDRHPGGEGR